MNELGNWFLVAIVVGLYLVIKSKQKLLSIPKKELVPQFEKKSSFACHLQEVVLNLPVEEYKLFYEDLENQRLIVESNHIGFFHWGFLFFLTCKENVLYVGIYPKGPNPPKGLALEKYLDKFILELEKIWSKK